MRWIGLLAITLATPTVGAESAHVAGCFDGVLPVVDTRLTDTEIGRVSWSTAYGSGCCEEPSCGCDDAGCCDSVGCDSGCCGSACCGSTCGGCLPCSKNCGLFGQGYLTHDPCGEWCNLPELLMGKLACKSERCFDDFISPMTNPLFFEDPRNVSELRGIFWNHNVPQAAGSGQVNLYALQIRARLSDKLSLIATKDGFVTSTNPLIDDGWADVALGLKYALYRDAREQRLLSAGFVYDMPVGSTRTLQAKGSGQFHLFATGGAELFDCGHWISGLGGILPADGGENSTFMYWSNHWDYQVRKGWYGVAEVNWFHWTDGGDDTLGLTGVEGVDAFNLGSGGVNGNDIVTWALGAKYKPNRKTELGIAYEVPLTDRRDIMENRLTVDLILRY